MTKLSFNDITPIDPFEGLSNASSNAANYFFSQAQALQQAKQREFSNRLAQQRLAEDRRINDSTIAERNFELKAAEEEKANRQRIKDIIANTTNNADKYIRNYAFGKNQEYVDTASKSISDAYRGFARSRGLTEAPPTITAKEGTKEYQTQTTARNQWFDKHAKISKEFETKVRPLVESTFLDNRIVDKDTAKSAITKRLLAQNVPIEKATATADILSGSYTDYAAANAAAREAHHNAASKKTDLVKALTGIVAKPGVRSSSGSTSGSLIGSTSAVKEIEKAGADIRNNFYDIVHSSPVPIQEAVKELINRNYSPKQANEIVAEAGRLSIKDSGNIDTERFISIVETLANKIPIKSSGSSTTALAAYNKPKLESINKLVNTAIAHSNAAMSTGLHTKVLDNKLNALRQFADKYTKNVPPVSSKSVVGEAIRKRNATNNTPPSVNKSNLPPKLAPIGDGTAESLAMAALQNPETQKDLTKFLQLRAKANSEKDPTKAITLHNQVQKEADRFKGIKDIPTEQLNRLLDSVNQYRSGAITPIQQTHDQLLKQVKAADEAISFAEEDLLKAKQAYETTRLPQFKEQIEELTQRIKDLHSHKQLWQGFLKTSNTSFLDRISNK